ncbi:hypothetical protein HY250_00300 [Candidatus Azambacteria bacterium]|nr:hypothetical protein [Candidatus Azambacteria bacterium]
MKKQTSDPKIKTILKEYNKDVKRHISTLSEDFKNQVKIVAEQYVDIKKDIGRIKETLDSHTETLDSHTETLNAHTEMIGSMKEDIEVMKVDIATTKTDVEIIKTDVEFIKGGLKKKVDYDEFAALERRLVLVESKVRR